MLGLDGQTPLTSICCGFVAQHGVRSTRCTATANLLRAAVNVYYTKTQNLLRTARITTRALDWTFGCLKQPNILSWLHWPRTYYLLQLLRHNYVERAFSVCGDLAPVMLIEAKLLRTRPRTRTKPRGRGRGQNHEAEAEDKITRPRTRPRTFFLV